ncbi:MAG: hypothetical protein ACRD72_15200 [Candidatus Angelobacter sp.]
MIATLAIAVIWILAAALFVAGFVGVLVTGALGPSFDALKNRREVRDRKF